jgi:TPR repeat protein
LRARRDIGGMAQHLRFKIAPVRSREDASKLRAEIAEMREIGADPAVWARFGPRTAAAAAEGPAALRAWAEKIDETCTMPDADAPDEMRTISDIAKLQFAIQICVGINKRLTFTQDIRTDEEVLALIEAGDSETIAKHRYDSALMQKARPAIERLARENHAEAINLLADLPGTPHYRYRVLKEKAAKLGSTDAIGALIRDLEFKRKYRDTIPLLRRAAELGDENCKRDLAQALDAGKHVKRDARTAFALYNEMQTKEGWRDTQLALRIAQMQWDGDGCPRDRDAALHAFFDLHIGDEAPYAAAVFIGDLYRDGLHGIAKDRDEAVAWYRDALTYGGIEAAAARKRLKDMKVKLTEEDGEDDEFDEEEREKLSNFWRVRA